MFILLVDFRPQSSLRVAQEIQWKNNLDLVVVGVHPRRVPVVDISSVTGKKTNLMKQQKPCWYITNTRNHIKYVFANFLI